MISERGGDMIFNAIPTYLDPCIFEKIFIAGIVKMHLLCFLTLFTHR